MGAKQGSGKRFHLPQGRNPNHCHCDSKPCGISKLRNESLLSLLAILVVINFFFSLK